jgi:hypothetical protein
VDRETTTIHTIDNRSAHRIPADIVQRRVSPTSIVERFDAEERIRPGLVVYPVLPVTHEFALQRHDEAGHRCDVVPASDAAHAGLGSVSPQRGLIGVIRVLAASIRVMGESSLSLMSLDSQPQGSQRQRLFSTTLSRKRLNTAGAS